MNSENLRNYLPISQSNLQNDENKMVKSRKKLIKSFEQSRVFTQPTPKNYDQIQKPLAQIRQEQIEKERNDNLLKKTSPWMNQSKA